VEHPDLLNATKAGLNADGEPERPWSVTALHDQNGELVGLLCFPIFPENSDA